MNVSFKKAVERHFQNIELDREQLAELQKLAQGRPVPGEIRRTRQGRWKAAMLAVITFMTAYWLSLPDMTDYTVDSIASEVALNHIKLKPMEIKTHDMREIRAYFDRLDFVPLQSSLAEFNQLSLLGGRYCSLQGHIAAQLRFEDLTNGGSRTLYQTAYRPDYFPALPVLEQGESPLTTYANGVHTRIWVEKGVLNVLAETP